MYLMEVNLEVHTHTHTPCGPKPHKICSQEFPVYERDNGGKLTLKRLNFIIIQHYPPLTMFIKVKMYFSAFCLPWNRTTELSAVAITSMYLGVVLSMSGNFISGSDIVPVQRRERNHIIIYRLEHYPWSFLPQDFIFVDCRILWRMPKIKLAKM